MEISKFPEILGDLNIHKHCVPGYLFSTHTHGNRLGDLIISIDKTYKIIYTVNNEVWHHYFLYYMQHAAESTISYEK